MTKFENNFLINHLPMRDSKFTTLEQYAKKNRVPIMEPISMHFLTQLIKIHEPNDILEIGSAIGYSALRMHDAYEKANIITIERNEKMAHIAKQNVAKWNETQSITVIHDDALAYIKELKRTNKKFDFIFIDAAKAHYKKFFTACEPLLNKDALIVCDNVLFKGYVANEHKNESIRMQKLADKIRLFLQWLVKRKDFTTSIVPIGDGISISIYNHHD